MTIVRIVDASRRDIHTAADLIARAFHPLPVTAWLVPDPVERERVMYANMRIYVEHAFECGIVLTTEERCAVAVWFARIGPLPDIPDYPRRLWLACGEHTGRFEALDTAFDTHHPTEPHHHLAFLAVHPERQGEGIGTALLHHYHAGLDADGIPAYLEAPSQRNRSLYARHGYTDHGDPIPLPDDGPPFWPMWREPRPQSVMPPASPAASWQVP